MTEKLRPQQLAIMGGAPAFSEALHVGRPNLGDRERLLSRIGGILDRRWHTNDGPLVREFEHRIASLLGVREVIAMCNGTIALQLLARALDLRGEVILPSFTFVATAHALRWEGITPVFADIRAGTHNVDPASIERLITPRTTAIVGVHIWGRMCDVEGLSALAEAHGLELIFDATHAFGCSHGGRMAGGFGRAEVLSFHATKFVSTFEGGAVTTDDHALAERLRLLRNFGFHGYDHVVSIGSNGKMSEVAAAMGLTSLESMEHFIVVNREHHAAYRSELRDLEQLRIVSYPPGERHNFQYVVVEVDPQRSQLDRDELVRVLWSEGVLARRYFFPGCHRMEPYRADAGAVDTVLPETERLVGNVMQLPTGPGVTIDEIRTVCSIIRTALKAAPLVRDGLHGPQPPHPPPAGHQPGSPGSDAASPQLTTTAADRPLSKHSRM